MSKEFIITEEQKTILAEKEWSVVIPKGAYIDLYREDFYSESEWEAVCDQVQQPHDSISITIAFIASTNHK